MTRRARFPFRLKLTIGAALLAAAPLIAVGALLIDVNADAVETSSRQLQIALADDLSRTLGGDLDEAQDGLGAVGNALTNDSLDHDTRLVIASLLVASNGALDNVSIYDARGALIDTIREPTARRVEPPAAIDRRVRWHCERDGVGMGDATRGGPHGESPRVLLAVPLQPTGRTTGYAASLVSLDPLQLRVDQLAATHLEALSGTLYVVDDELRVLAHPDLERANALASARDEPILRGIDPATLVAARSAELEVGDRTILGTVVPITARPWAVVVEIPVEEAYASLGAMRRIVIITVAASVLFALAAAFLFARRITAPISKLTDFAADLAARRFDRRVDIDTRDELSLLGEAMSRAAGELEEGEARVRREVAIRADLGRYLPAELVEKVVRREQDMELGGRRLPVTVLFADVVAFTPLTEKLPPEDVVAILNELFTILTDVVFRHGGTVDKFIGDCVMAMWGAPTPQPDHARRAVAAAEDMLRWLETANASWKERYGIAIQLGIGVNTGEAVVGNVGSERRMEYTAVGDVVNVAARLEVIARPQQILVSDATREAAGDGFDYVEIGERTVAGRAAPVRLYEVRV